MMRPVIWDNIDLVVFDLDGTLYNQRRLRARMALNLLYSAMLSRTPNTLNVLRTFRKCREVLAEESRADFVERQYEYTALRCRCTAEEVRKVVYEWIEQRPLSYLSAYRYSGVKELFESLRQSGRTIAVFSDYPAEEKLEALALNADLVVSATDTDVQRLKPDPAGLHKILNVTGVEASHSLMVGDRFDRDWAVASRVGMPAIIRSRHEDSRCGTFRSFHDALFNPVIQPPEQQLSIDRRRNNTMIEQRDGNASQF
jgi:HAD superfamily hydrolase (TIGR01549 family)